MSGARPETMWLADGVTLTIVSRATAPQRERALPRALAEGLFEAWCPATAAGGRAIAGVAELGVALGGALRDDTASLRERVREALRDGRVIALREAPHETRAAAAASARDEDDRPTDPPPPRETKTWVTIRLVDDGDPRRPVAHARFRIKLPDGATREGRLDAMGAAHFEGLDPGLCEVTFPDYDREAWRRLDG